MPYTRNNPWYYALLMTRVGYSRVPDEYANDAHFYLPFYIFPHFVYLTQCYLCIMQHKFHYLHLWVMIKGLLIERCQWTEFNIMAALLPPLDAGLVESSENIKKTGAVEISAEISI